MVKPPEWWHSTRIIQAFDSVLSDKMKKPSLLKRISSFGSVRQPPRLTPAEQHIQLSIRKRASAFVDARDDLETKIGRLSRRLNFLMTESDLWRDKFVQFEQYAEKLSVEASDLRSKINREQKETKRLSSMITLTAAEKMKLQDRKCSFPGCCDLRPPICSPYDLLFSFSQSCGIRRRHTRPHRRSSSRCVNKWSRWRTSAHR